MAVNKNKPLNESIQELTEQIQKLESKKVRQGTSVGDIADKINVETFFPGVLSPVGRAGQGVANVIQGVLNSGRKRKLNKLRSKLSSATAVGSSSITAGDESESNSGGVGAMPADFGPMLEMMQGIVLSVENLNASLESGIESIKYCLVDIEDTLESILSKITGTGENKDEGERKERFGRTKEFIRRGAKAIQTVGIDLKNSLMAMIPFLIPAMVTMAGILLPALLPMIGIALGIGALVAYFANHQKMVDKLAKIIGIDPEEELKRINAGAAEDRAVIKQRQEDDRRQVERIGPEATTVMNDQIEQARADSVGTRNFASRMSVTSANLAGTEDLSIDSLEKTARGTASTSKILERNRERLLDRSGTSPLGRLIYGDPFVDPQSTVSSFKNVVQAGKAAELADNLYLLGLISDRDGDDKISEGSEREEFDSYLDAGLHKLDSATLGKMVVDSTRENAKAAGSGSVGGLKQVNPVKLLQSAQSIGGPINLSPSISESRQLELEEDARNRGVVGAGAGGSPTNVITNNSSTTIVETSDPALLKERGRGFGDSTATPGI